MSSPTRLQALLRATPCRTAQSTCSFPWPWPAQQSFQTSWIDNDIQDNHKIPKTRSKKRGIAGRRQDLGLASRVESGGSSALNLTFSASRLCDSNFISQSSGTSNSNCLSPTPPPLRHSSGGTTKQFTVNSRRRISHFTKLTSGAAFLRTNTPPELPRPYREKYFSPVVQQENRQIRQYTRTPVRASQTAKTRSQAYTAVNHSNPLQSPTKTHNSETAPPPPDNFSSSSTVDSMTTDSTSSPPAQHKPLVVGRTKPQTTPSSSTTMDSSSTSVSTADKAIPTEVKETLNHEISENLNANTASAAPADGAQQQQASSKKKEKAPKQPKPPKAASPAPAPLSPALIDLRVGHILRAIAHPNADSLYVSTIAMGDREGTEHTQVDEETGKVVRTVCSGLNGLVPLAEMQDRKIVVVANLKPVNMRSIKSAAMVLAASPKQEEGADPHAADRVVELVNPPEGSEAGDKVYFEGWEYGESKGPEKQLNPKKKQWEAIQPGFFTGEDLTVGFDAGVTEVEGDRKGTLVVEGKGKCTVKTLKGAVVR